MTATQKEGAAIPRTANILPALSKIVSRFTADKMPRGIPTSRLRTKAAPASWRVAGNRLNNTSRADLLYLIESPKSP